ncbi:MAG: DUF4422 domain-containing protein, partial [Bacteroides sp.]|nr:DUF4422 domain-containing protein [Bacteroides sp.]
KDVDYIGLAHYRRYFDLNNEELCKLLKYNDILLAKPLVLPSSVYNELVYWTSLEDSTIFIDSILSLFPEYKDDVISYYFMGNRFSQCNMMVMRKEVFEEYCNFLFPILKNTEDRIKLSGYARQRRVLGYLAETALGLWIKHNNYNVKTVGLATELPSNKLKLGFNNIRFDLAFKISRRLRRPSCVPIIPSLKIGLDVDGVQCNAIAK